MDPILTSSIEIIKDFGPLDLGLTCKFCSQLQEAINRAKDKGKPVIYSCSQHPHHRSNGAVMICAYMIFIHNASAERAYAPFMGITPPFITFRDAGFCINTFPITVLDCARAMRKAVSLGHFHYKSFNPTAFHQLAKLQNGDFSWIIPGKFLAFSGPITKRRQLSPGVYSLSPEGYIPVMKKLDVSCIVRFNSKCYDRNVFLANGIRHVDLYYEDGGNPTEDILQAFLQLCENERAAIAVHCKAGLGRTGTNIAAYMMKHYAYTAKECMAWCRLCRPGSIVGPQQQYLESIEERMFKEGAEYRLKHRLPHPSSTAMPHDEASASGGSVDGQLSTYTGLSLTGPVSIAGMSLSGGTSHSNSASNSAGMGSYSTERVATPPPLGSHSYSNRPKQTTESLFRNAVSSNRAKDIDFTHTSPVGQQKHSVHMQSTANSHSNGHSNDLDLRRPATSGGLVVTTANYDNTNAYRNTSPLRRGSGVGNTAHSSSFTYGNTNAISSPGYTVHNSSSNTGSPIPQRPNTSLHNHTTTTPTVSRLGAAGRGVRSIADHEGGPGKGAYTSEQSTMGSYLANHSGSTTPLSSPAGRRSASTSRYRQQSSGNYTLASPGYTSTGNGSSQESNGGIQFYDDGRQVRSHAGSGNTGVYKTTSHSGAAGTGSSQLRFSGDYSGRPGTSGGAGGSGGLRHTAGGLTQQLSNSTGNSAKLSRHDYSSYDHTNTTSNGNGSSMTISRPRTSGGIILTTTNSSNHHSTNSSSNGRSQSNGRSNLYKRRF